ncbi:conserved hypothetical protein [Candidatus Brocadia pituitae]|nr:conserved hypothetical protein [Candidatus Brocadia pituitae]
MLQNKRFKEFSITRKLLKNSFGNILLAMVLFILTGSGVVYGGNAKYIILFIGDGWGPKHIEAVNKYTGATPFYQSGTPWVNYYVSTFPLGGSYDTTQAWSGFNYINTTADTQDSACTATALYSGFKTSPYRVSVSADTLTKFFTIGQRAKELGKTVGAISTVPVSHATPGTWVAHNDSRANTFAIADEGFFGDPNTTGTIATDSKYAGGHGPTIPFVDILIGARGANYVSSQILNKLRSESGQTGKHVLVERQTGVGGGDALMSVANTSTTLKVAGLFDQVYYNADGSGYSTENPTLSESILAAVKVLGRGTNGFALMVEGGAIDYGAHANNMNHMIGEAKDFDNAIQTVTNWVDDPTNDATWSNTLVIVTADHECGYLTAGPGVMQDQPLGNVNAANLSKEKIVSNSGGRRASWDDTNSNNIIDNGEMVHWYWNSGSHTNSLVRLYARGAGSELFQDYAIHTDSVRGLYLDNTNVFSVMNSAIDGTGESPPFANNDLAVTDQDTAVDINVIANDSDSDGTIDPSTVTVTSNPNNGIALANVGGTVTYTPNTGFTGTDTFKYTVKDNAGAVSNEATVTVTVVSDTHVFTAYNDLSWSTGQVNTNITLYTTGQNGLLKNYFTGLNTTATLTIAGGYIDTNGTPFQGSNANSGTDAYTVFNDIVNSGGLIGSFNATNITITFTGLDPNLNYEFVLFGNRNNASYTNRSTTTTISDITSFTNTSTPGATFSGSTDPAVTIVNGYNTVNGYVARFTDIKPGSDGDLLITVTSPTNQFYANALMLRATQESDTVPPTVSATSPQSFAQNVLVASTITATFSEAMNAATITNSTFTINGVAGTVSYSGTTATFTPSSPLAYSTVYTATITTGVTDVAGNPMTANYTWNFTTEAAPDTTPPTVNATSPQNSATNVPITNTIFATFSEAMNAATITNSTFTINGVAGTVSYSGTTATFTPSSPLAYSTVYTATITTGVTDVAGNPMTANYTWNFTTVAASDTTPPTVNATSPQNNATNVPITSAITATFSEAMNAATITNSTFTINGVAGTVSYSGTTATFTPSSPLAYSTVYTATITTGVTDVAGNPMTANYTWNFTTAASGGIGGQQVYYAFDEGTGSTATDSSGNGRNGTISGATWTSGKIGGALSFNGTNHYVSIPRLNYDEISASAWFYRNSVDTVNPDTIFGGWSWNGGGEGYGLYFDQYASNTIKFIVTSKTSGGVKTQRNAIKNLITSTGKWYHVVGTYNKTTGQQKLYVDGQLVNTQSHPAGNTVVPYTAASYMAIGTLTWNYGHMNGKVDDVQVYNRALNDQEVLSLFNGGTGSDTTPPTVNATSPQNNATNVPITSAITATFSEVMNAATITNSTFTINGVAGTVSYSGTTATFTPSSPLAYSTVYTATITTGVTDVAGNPMTANYTWNFTTVAASDTTPPTVNATSPQNNATNVPITSAITATFSETMNAATITNSTFTINGVAGTVSYSGTTATFTPSSPLAYSTVYTATITTGVTDVAGNPMTANYTWNFTTADNNMLVYYRFDENSGTTAADSSGNSNNGAIINGPVWTTGKINNAISFDGINDYVNISNESNFDFERSNSFSVSAWVKLTPVSGNDYMIISKLDVAPTYRGWAFFIDGNDGSLRVHLTNNWGTSSIIRKDSALSVTDNSWHHVAFTYNGSSLASGLNFYVDGVLSNGTTYYNNLSATILNDVTPTLAAYTTGSSWLKGTIDEARVYNRALSAQEVLSLFSE